MHFRTMLLFCAATFLACGDKTPAIDENPKDSTSATQSTKPCPGCWPSPSLITIRHQIMSGPDTSKRRWWFRFGIVRHDANEQIALSTVRPPESDGRQAQAILELFDPAFASRGVFSADVRAARPGSTELTSLQSQIDSSIGRAPGVYHAMTYVVASSSASVSNDTLVTRLFVTPERDAMPVRLLAPGASDQNGNIAYAAGQPIPIEVLVRNNGVRREENVLVGYELVDVAGAVIARDLQSVSLNAGELTLGSFPPAVPTMPGTYNIRVFTTMAGDGLAGNDTIYNWQSDPHRVSRLRQPENRSKIRIAGNTRQASSTVR